MTPCYNSGTPARSTGASQDMLRYDANTELPTYSETEMVSAKPESEFLL